MQQDLERYHRLVDKHIGGALSTAEAIELMGIEERLDAANHEEAERVREVNLDWFAERGRLIERIERLRKRIEEEPWTSP